MDLNRRLHLLIRTVNMSFKRQRLSELCVKFVMSLLTVYLVLLLRSYWVIEGALKKLGHTAAVYSSTGELYEYNSESHPLVFIGGHPRSGTTLMRAMLDAHAKVRCGEESRIIPRIVQMRENWFRSEKEKNRLIQGGIDDNVINAAMSSFILETIAQHGEPAEVLCNKDPLTLKSGDYISSLFPKSKWLFMMRDGRAVIHSVTTRKVSISGYQLDNPRQCLGRWNTVVQNMNEQCNKIGSKRCMIVYYEQLVLHPKRWMTLILDFLDLPWDDSVLHHEEKINKPGGVRVSMVERSSDQIIKPINVDALTSWVGKFPQDLLDDMDSVAPMLEKFGYDPHKNPPFYGVPDGEVLNNTLDVHENRQMWEVKSKQLIAEMDKKHPD